MGKDPSELYKFKEKIGKGSFGEVYKAEDTSTKKLVAIKIIDLEKSDGKQFIVILLFIFFKNNFSK